MTLSNPPQGGLGSLKSQMAQGLGGAGSSGPSLEEIKRQQEHFQKKAAARKTVGAWIYLKEPTEAVKRAMELLDTPQYPDGRAYPYDPNENQAMTGSGSG